MAGALAGPGGLTDCAHGLVKVVLEGRNGPNDDCLVAAADVLSEEVGELGLVVGDVGVLADTLTDFVHGADAVIEGEHGHVNFLVTDLLRALVRLCVDEEDF